MHRAYYYRYIQNTDIKIEGTNKGCAKVHNFRGERVPELSIFHYLGGLLEGVKGGSRGSMARLSDKTPRFKAFRAILYAGGLGGLLPKVRGVACAPPQPPEYHQRHGATGSARGIKRSRTTPHTPFAQICASSTPPATPPKRWRVHSGHPGIPAELQDPGAEDCPPQGAAAPETGGPGG